MVKEYWERIDKEIRDALFCTVLLTLFRDLMYAKVLDLLVTSLESERKRLGIKRVKNE